MDQHANTKNVSEPGQAQNPELQESARQAEEPPRKCKICGGPDHRGCGCEAKQLREAQGAGLKENEAKALHEPEAPAAGHRRTVGMVESEAPAALKLTQAEREETFRKVIDEIINRSSPGEIKTLLKAQILPWDFAKDIKILSERSELIGDSIFDLCQYCKSISEDLKTIKENLIKKDEVKNASENQN